MRSGAETAAVPGPTAFFFELDWTEVAGAYAREGLYGNRESAARALARAIAASPGWNKYPPGVVALRDGDPPVLGVLFDDVISDVRSLETRAAHLPLALELLRFRSWDQVVEDATALADRLGSELTDSERQAAKWVAIPRGGRIVLGLLSYLLDLPPTPPAGRSGAPLVIVDDCILSGRRLRHWLSDIDPGREVVVATLYSHPEARERIQAMEASVTRVISGRDLRDHARDQYGDDEEAWRRRWERRSGSDTCWTGLPDRICFPWNEPDTTLWNGSEEIQAWRTLPEGVCVKNRARPGDHLDVEVMDEPRGYVIPALNVLAASVGSSLILARREGSVSLRLSGSAARMWEVITREPTRCRAVEALAAGFDVSPSAIQADLEEFEHELLELGFLERRP